MQLLESATQLTFLFISVSSTIGLDPFSDLKVSYLTIFLLCIMSQMHVSSGKNQLHTKKHLFSVRNILEEKALLDLF